MCLVATSTFSIMLERQNYNQLSSVLRESDCSGKVQLLRELLHNNSWGKNIVIVQYLQMENIFCDMAERKQWKQS